VSDPLGCEACSFSPDGCSFCSGATAIDIANARADVGVPVLDLTQQLEYLQRIAANEPEETPDP